MIHQGRETLERGDREAKSQDLAVVVDLSPRILPRGRIFEGTTLEFLASKGARAGIQKFEGYLLFFGGRGGVGSAPTRRYPAVAWENIHVNQVSGRWELVPHSLSLDSAGNPDRLVVGPFLASRFSSVENTRLCVQSLRYAGQSRATRLCCSAVKNPRPTILPRLEVVDTCAWANVWSKAHSARLLGIVMHTAQTAVCLQTCYSLQSLVALRAPAGALASRGRKGENLLVHSGTCTDDLTPTRLVDRHIKYPPSQMYVICPSLLLTSLNHEHLFRPPEFVTMDDAAIEHQYERTRIRQAKRLAANFLDHLDSVEKKAFEDGQV